MNEVVDLLATGQRFLLAFHRNPDGDTIGGSLGLAAALRRLGKHVDVASADEIPPSLQFLPGVDLVRPWSEMGSTYDAVVLLDCSDPSRPDAPRPLSAYAPVLVNVDHHRTNVGYGDITYLDFSAAAVGELALRLVDALHVPLVQEVALPIYVAIVTDTGGFRYDATSAATHQAAARLIQTGIDVGRVSEALFDQLPVHSLRFLGQALSKLQYDHEAGLAWIELEPEDVAQLESDDLFDALGLVNYARSVAGVAVGALFRPDSRGGTKVSLRARVGYDISPIARAFGGGGHALAAGATVPGSTREVADKVIARLKQELLPQA